MQKKKKYIYTYETLIDEMEGYAQAKRISFSRLIEILWEDFNESKGDNFEQKAEMLYQYFRNKDKDLMTGIRLSSRQAEFNTNVMLEILNTFAVKQNYEQLIDTTNYKSPVLAKATDIVSKRLEAYRQKAAWKKGTEK